MSEFGLPEGKRYLLLDRDSKYPAAFRATSKSGGVRAVRLPAGSPSLNAFAGRWVRSVKDECVRRLVLLGERPGGLLNFYRRAA